MFLVSKRISYKYSTHHISYSPYIITRKSILYASAKITPYLTSDISISTSTIDIQPQHQFNDNTPKHIPKLIDLNCSLNYTPTTILSSSAPSMSSSIRSIDNSPTLVLEYLLTSEVNYNFIVSLIDSIKLPNSYITSAGFLTSTATMSFTNILLYFQ